MTGTIKSSDINTDLEVSLPDVTYKTPGCHDIVVVLTSRSASVVVGTSQHVYA